MSGPPVLLGFWRAVLASGYGTGRADEGQRNPPYSRRLFPGLGFRQLPLELLDARLQARQPRSKQADVEERHVRGRRIERVAVAEPGRVVDLDVREAQLLQHASGLRRARAALAIDDGLLVGIEPGVQPLE